MDREQAHARQVASGGDRSGYSVGDVVKLQVQEDPETHPGQSLDRPRAGRRKELAADLEEACDAVELPCQGTGRPQTVKIQGDD